MIFFFLAVTPNHISVSPDPEANMLQNIGQRHVFGLEGLPLFLELVCQADPPALLGHRVSSLLGDVPAHQLCGGFVAPFCSHACREACHRRSVMTVNRGERRARGTHKHTRTHTCWSPPYVNRVFCSESLKFHKKKNTTVMEAPGGVLVLGEGR